MRQFYIILFFFVYTLPVYQQTQTNAIYVYRNDGDFNAFLREDIDSITLSYYDKDSICHSDIVCQVFHTPDSIYRIPIHSIDSVSFIQPETKYQSDVILLGTEYIPYIINVTDKIIIFSKSIPETLLPKKGSVIVAMTPNQPFSNAFAGRVQDIEYKVDGIYLGCSGVTIDDIYEQFVYTGKTIAADVTTVPLKYSKEQKRIIIDEAFKLDPIMISSGPISIEAHPTITTFFTINKNPNLKAHIALVVTSCFDVNIELNAEIEKNEKPRIIWGEDIPIRTNIPGLCGFIRGGIFYKALTSASVNAKFPGNICWKFGFSQSDDEIRLVKVIKNNIQNPELSIDMNGELDAGLCARIGFNYLDDKLISLYLTGYGGVYVKSDLSIKNQEPFDWSVYNTFKDSKLEIGAYFCGEPGYTIFNNENNFCHKDEEQNIEKSYEQRIPFKSWYFFPVFTIPDIKQGADQRSLIVSCIPSRDLITPVKLGFCIEDDNGTLIEQKWCDDNYYIENDWPENAFWKQFNGLYAGRKYVFYPCFKFMEHEIKALPLSKGELNGKVITNEANSITDSSAMLFATASSAFDFSQSTVSVGFCIGTHQNLTIYNSTILNAPAEPSFSASVESLTENTTYYYRAFVMVGTQVFYGSVLSFTTNNSSLLLGQWKWEYNYDNTNYGYQIITYNELGQGSVLDHNDYYNTSEVLDFSYRLKEINDKKYIIYQTFENGETYAFECELLSPTQVRVNVQGDDEIMIMNKIR